MMRSESVELRQYAKIVLRRWWLPIGLLAAVALFSLPGSLSPAPPTYQASMRFAVGMTPEEGRGEYYTYDRYYTWLASEYLVDDLAEVVKSSSFAAAVSDELAAQGITVAPGSIGASTQAGKLHRILSVSISWGDEAELRSIANAAAKVLMQRNAEFMAQLGSENAQAYLIDPPAVYPMAKSLTDRLGLPIRLGLALIAGVALAFLLDYLDDSVRTDEDLQALGLTVLARIP
jgi:capsular polysaccharide biosynthesis protein